MVVIFMTKKEVEKKLIKLAEADMEKCFSFDIDNYDKPCAVFSPFIVISKGFESTFERIAEEQIINGCDCFILFHKEYFGETVKPILLKLKDKHPNIRVVSTFAFQESYYEKCKVVLTYFPNKISFTHKDTVNLKDYL